jgi:hypothetical protein
MKWLALIAALALAGCATAPIRQAETGNPGRSADLIAVVDGCKIWRIYDLHYVYFARCPNGVARTETETGGKYSHRVEVVADE